MTRLLDAAHAALQAELCVIPAARDGTKAPWPDGPRWQKYQTDLPTLEDLDRWFGPDGYPGIGLVCGQVSGGLEMLEFEGRAITEGIYDAFLARAGELGLLELVDRITDGYSEETPTGGIHWLYRCPTVAGNTKLARRPAGEEEKASNPGETVAVLIETRGEGGFVVVAPSSGPTHPTGRPWELTTGGFHTIATVTPDERDELLALARSFDRMPERTSHETPNSTEARPGDDYNARTTWAELLEPRAWTIVYDHGGEIGWRRPGKDRGVSATTNHTGTDRLKVFSTSTPFDTETTYDRFGAYALLEHHGDLRAAASALRRDGYGSSTSSSGPAEGPQLSAPDGDAVEYPVVIVNGRPLRDTSLELLDHLVDANDPPEMYVRGGMLTRVRRDEKDEPIVEPMTETILRNRVSHVVDTMRVNKDGVRSHVHPPMEVMRDLVSIGRWRYPPLEAVTEIPTLRPDGTIHGEPGYDPITRLLHVPAQGLEVPAVAGEPDDDDIDRAIKLVRELLHDFPFESDMDAANALGCLLTPLVRPAIPGQVPLALIDAPEPGTGKSLLADVVSAIATGRPAAKRAMPRGDEEIRKMITATLMGGSTVVVLDNVDEAVRAPSLAAMLTTEMWEDRLLGRTEIVKIPNRASWIATGNNLQVAGDLARRCYRIRLDAKEARPYMRTTFLHPLPEWALERRGELIWALLTIARDWWAKGQPAADVPTLGGFTPWAETIGGILANIGITTFLGNTLSFVEQADQESTEWEAFLVAWAERFEDRSVTVADVVSELECSPSAMKDTLPSDLADHLDKRGFRQKFGMALTKRGGRHYGEGSWRLVAQPKDRRRVALWSVLSANGHVPEIAATDDEVTLLSDFAARDRGTRGTLPSHVWEKSEESSSAENDLTVGGTGSASPAVPRAEPRDLCTRCQQPSPRLITADWDPTQRLCPDCCQAVIAEHDAGAAT